MRMFLVFLVCVSFNVSSEIYKWVDENGVTHYGAHKPVSVDAKKMEIKETKKLKQLNPEVKETINSFAKELTTVKKEPKGVNCKKAVSYAKDSVDTMLSVGKKNLQDGYMNANEYKKTAEKLNGIKSRISVSECRSAQGSVKKFYKCMSDGFNHVAACGGKYNYGS
jgi:hypothetical protein